MAKSSARLVASDARTQRHVVQPEPRRTAEQQVEAASARSLRSATRSAESKQRFLHRVGRKVLVRERRGRMLVRRSSRPLRTSIASLDRDRRPPLRRTCSRPSASAHRRRESPSPAADRYSDRRRAGRPASLLVEHRRRCERRTSARRPPAAHRRAPLREVAKPVVLPPRRPCPRGDASRADTQAAIASVARRCVAARSSGTSASNRARNVLDARLQLADTLSGGSGGFGVGRAIAMTLRNHACAERLQPVAECERRAAVVAVVVLDGFLDRVADDADRVRLERDLQRAPMQARPQQVGHPG